MKIKGKFTNFNLFFGFNVAAIFSSKLTNGIYKNLVQIGVKLNLRKEKNMRIVMAIIKPHKLEEVREGLTSLGIEGMTITEVKGYGRQKGQAEIYRGAEYSINYLPKLKIELAVNDEVVDSVIEAITKSAQTGKIGDGKIFVYPIEKAIRIRTNETNAEAI